MTTTELKKFTRPPQPTAQSVRSHKQALIMALNALQAAAPALAAASALGSPEAKSGLAALGAKIAAVEFEISCNASAIELARQEDADNETAWRAQVQELPIEKNYRRFDARFMSFKMRPE
jgi:hypothetical protein